MGGGESGVMCCIFREIVDLHADTIVLVDFLHVLGSIEGGFISEPNAWSLLP